MTGIYKIQNQVNGKVYIGQSLDIKKRWREHRFSSRHKDDRDHHLPIHLALSKYGEDNFLFEVIEECQENELNEKEIYWIAQYNSCDKDKGYNIAKGGQDKTHIGRPVEVYDLDGNYIKTCPNGAEVARMLDKAYVTIRQVLDGSRVSCAGYQLKYADSDKKIEKIKLSVGGRIPVNQLDLITGQIIASYPSFAAASRATGYPVNSIKAACRGQKNFSTCKWEVAK